VARASSAILPAPRQKRLVFERAEDLFCKLHRDREIETLAPPMAVSVRTRLARRRREIKGRLEWTATARATA